MLLRTGLLALAAAAMLVAQPAGIPVRPAPTDYATRNVADGVTLAASIVPAAQMRKIFSKDLDHEGYLVVEVAVYPSPGTPLDITPDEFTLRGADSAILITQSPAAIAAGEKQRAQTSNSKGPQLPGNVHVYNTATIGYESGGPYRRGGVYTGTSTTVAVGDPRNDPNYPPPPPSQAPPRGAKPDRTALKQELEDKELPAGRTGVAVAGYLYFLKPSGKQKSSEYELVWHRTGAQMRLAIPVPK